MYIKMTSGEVYKTLIGDETGSWIISCDNPSAPIFVNRCEIDSGERVEANGTCLPDSKEKLSRAAVERLEMIQPLLDDDRAITDENVRRELAQRSAEEFHTDRKRVLRLYYRYLATGILISSKKRESKNRPEFDNAIKTHYFSAKKHSLRTAYELMVLENYCDADGVIKDDVPSFSAFKQYYYRRFSRSKQKEISRDGLTKYQRDSRMLYGSAMAYRDSIGSYQIDETTADIYLVSAYDRSKVIGRPNIYLASDTASGLITGVYVGFDAGETALMKCIANASSFKTDDWNCIGLPSEIICDRGQEFVGRRTEELCRRYGVVINSAPPFRAELKPVIERVIGLIQDSYKSSLQGKGVINEDAKERWAVDYRRQAILTLEEFTQIVITAIKTLNQSRVLDDIGHLPLDAPHTPLALWDWFMEQGKSSLLKVDEEELYVLSLARSTASITRTGITFNNLRYVPDSEAGLRVGDRVVFAYDEQDVSSIYVITKDGYIRCHLAESCSRYIGYSGLDVGLMKKDEKSEINTARVEELKSRVQMRQQIMEIIDKAESERKKCRR